MRNVFKKKDLLKQKVYKGKIQTKSPFINQS